MDEQNEKITLHRDGESIRIHIPLKFKRRGGRKEIIVADGLPNFPHDRTVYQKPLVVALARAFRWQNLLETEKVASITVLAKQLGVDRAYVRGWTIFIMPAGFAWATTKTCGTISSGLF